MKKRNIYKNTYLKFIIREAKRNNCLCEIKRNKHFRVRLTSLKTSKSETLTVCSTPSSSNYIATLEKDVISCIEKIDKSNSLK
jgi:hypothetical protein